MSVFEVWHQLGRTRRVVARFRLLSDARKYLEQHQGEGTLEILPEGAPSRSTAPRTSRAPSSSVPPASEGGRRRSGVQGKYAIAVEHPDEFIADRAGNGDSEPGD